VIEIETKYTELCMEKTTLESEQARLGRSVRMETIAKLCSQLLCFSVSLTRFACVNSCGTGCGVRKLTRGWLTYPRRLRRSDLSSETLETLLFLWPEGTGIYTIRYSYYEWHFNQCKCNSQSFTRRRCTEHHTASEWCHDPFAFGVSLAVHKTQPLSPRSVNSNGHVASPAVTAVAACDSVAVAARAAARVAKANVHSLARALAAPLRLVGPPLREISAASTGRQQHPHSSSDNCPAARARASMATNLRAGFHQRYQAAPSTTRGWRSPSRPREVAQSNVTSESGEV
jgi:hypothetical protein